MPVAFSGKGGRCGSVLNWELLRPQTLFSSNSAHCLCKKYLGLLLSRIDQFTWIEGASGRGRGGECEIINNSGHRETEALKLGTNCVHIY